MARNKRFLSDSHEEHGSVSWYVKHGHPYRDVEDEDERISYIDADLRLTDCTNIITLEFDARSYKAAHKRLEKLNTLIKELEDMREAYIETMRNSKFKK